jgi:hypothetical protein
VRVPALNLLEIHSFLLRHAVGERNQTAESIQDIFSFLGNLTLDPDLTTFCKIQIEL